MILRRKDSKGPADKYFDNWKDYDEKKNIQIEPGDQKGSD